MDNSKEIADVIVSRINPKEMNQSLLLKKRYDYSVNAADLFKKIDKGSYEPKHIILQVIDEIKKMVNLDKTIVNTDKVRINVSADIIGKKLKFKISY